jgi:hypothetical protein
MLGFSKYNYDHFTREILHANENAAFSGPEPGADAPDFRARTLEGEAIRLGQYAGKKNVLLVFGSATCPMTAISLPGINHLYGQFHGDVEFIFNYTREANPGERIPAHNSMEQKTAAARFLRDEEDLWMPVVLDDLHGSIHRRYSKLPNAAFLIDKSGRVAFRCLWARPEPLAAAMEELLEFQREHGGDHTVVRGGQDLSMPVSYGTLYAYRALQRGGRQSLRDFQHALGFRRPTASSADKSLLGRPARLFAIGTLATIALAGGVYAGFELRRRRLGGGGRINPYRAYEKEKIQDTDAETDYGAIGI